MKYLIEKSLDDLMSITHCNNVVPENICIQFEDKDISKSYDSIIVCGSGDVYSSRYIINELFSKSEFKCYFKSTNSFGLSISKLVNDASYGKVLVVFISMSASSEKLKNYLKFLDDNNIDKILITKNSKIAPPEKTIDISGPCELITPGISSIAYWFYALIVLHNKISLVNKFYDWEKISLSCSHFKSCETEIISASRLLASASHIDFVSNGVDSGLSPLASAKFNEITAFHTSYEQMDEWVHIRKFSTSSNPFIIIFDYDSGCKQQTQQTINIASNFGYRVITISDNKYINSIQIPYKNSKNKVLNFYEIFSIVIFLAIMISKKLGRHPMRNDISRNLVETTKQKPITG